MRDGNEPVGGGIEPVYKFRNIQIPAATRRKNVSPIGCMFLDGVANKIEGIELVAAALANAIFPFSLLC